MSTNIQCTDEVNDPNTADGVGRGSVTTTDNSTVTIASVPVATGNTQGFVARFLARRTDSSVGTTYMGTVQLVASDVSGSLGIEGSVVATSVVNTVGYVLAPISASVNGNNIDFTVTGQTSKTFDWTISYQYIYVS